MSSVWHVEQALTGSHANLILVNASAVGIPALVGVQGDGQK